MFDLTTTPYELQLSNPLAITGWDAEIGSLPQATFFHTAAWARVLWDTYGYNPIYLTLRIGGKIAAVLPVMEVSSWLTGKRGVSLPFSDDVEILHSGPQSLRLLFEYVQTLAGKRNWKYFESRGGRSGLGDVPYSASFFKHHLKLQKNESAMLAQFDGSVRRAIRKAGQNELTVEFSQSVDSIRTFYHLFCKTRQRHGVPPQPYAFFANIQKHVLANHQGWVVLARQKNVPVAGAVFFHSAQAAMYKFGASDPAFHHTRANNFVIWEAIRHYAQKDFTDFDFGRTSISNTGLRSFKLGWGTRERTIDYVTYHTRSRSFLSARVNRGQRLFDVYKFVPIFLSRIIGRLLYRHIAAVTLMFNWVTIANYN